MYEKGTKPIDSIKLTLKKFITKFDINIFFISFVFSLVVHLFMFTNKMINHDDIDGLYSDCGYGLSSGRWLLHLMTLLTGSFSSNWFDGVIGALFLSLGAMLIIRFLKINHYLPACLASFALVSFPTVASTYSYMFNASQYLFSLFISVLGALLIKKGKVWSMVLGSIAVACAMGCYQSYFCLTAILLVISVIMDLLDGKFENAKQLFIRALKYVCFLALGMVLYFVILKLCLWVTGTELVSYKNMDSMGSLTIAQIVERIKNAYLYFGAYYINWNSIYNKFFPILSLLSLLISFSSFIYLIYKKAIFKKIGLLILAVLLLIVFPLGCFLAYIMADLNDVHQVMLYPAVIPLILPCVILDRLEYSGRKIKDKLIGGFTIILILLQATLAYEFAFVTNRAYFYMDMTYENTFAYFTKLTTRIETIDGYEPDMRVALIGNATMPTTVPDAHMTGVITGNTALNIYSRATFLHHYLGTEYVYATAPEKEAIMQTQAFQEMPCYPAKDSIRIIDGIITVRFS